MPLSILSLMLVAQLGLAGDVSPDQMNLGQASIPGWVWVVPSELVITFDGPGTYTQTIDVSTLNGSGRTFRLYYCPGNMSLKGIIDGGNKGTKKSRLNVQMTITDEEWAELKKERMESQAAMTYEERKKVEDKFAANPNLADGVSKIGWRISDKNDKPIGVMDIPVFFKFNIDPIKNKPTGESNMQDNIQR